MPVHAKGKKIVETKTGRVVGKSKSPTMAKKAATARNMAHAGVPLTRRRSQRGR